MVKSSYLNSAFSDRYKGIFFKITFYRFPKGWATDLEVDGYPLIEELGNLQVTKEEAQAAAEKTARRIIDQHQVEPAHS